MIAPRITPAALDRKFWTTILGMLGLIALSVYGFHSAPGHPIYSLAMILLAFGGASRAIALYTESRIYRDAYLVLMGIVIGIILVPFLL